MRVTQMMLSNQMLLNLSNNNEVLGRQQNMLATGKKINAPSDDPVGVTYAMRYSAQISHNEQYQSNVSTVKSWLDLNDTVLGQVNNVVQRAYELSVQGNTDVLTPQARNSIASEVDQLFQQAVQQGNTQFNGKYIFNGGKTDTAPYTAATATTDSADTGQIQLSVGEGVYLSVNVTGSQAFGSPTDADNLFGALKQLVTGLQTNNSTNIAAAQAKLISRLQKLQEVRADVGARANRAEAADNRLQDMNVNMKALLSDTQDADVAKVITDLKMAENVHQASLAAGARVITPTLVDFLR